jgi:hypothetical protein
MAALAPAGGFVSTARDAARFYNQLNPATPSPILSAAARRAMIHKRWKNPGSPLETYYGLGMASGSTWGWNWFGHGGSLAGYITRTVTVVDLELTLSFLTNSSDGWANPWCDGAMSILRSFATHGAPQRRVRDWTGRWWTSFSMCDLVPMGRSVLLATPTSVAPFAEAGVVDVTARDAGRITGGTGYGSFGEEVRRVRNKAGRVIEIWIGNGRLVTRGRAAADLAKARKAPARSRDRSRARRRRRPRDGKAPTGSAAR